MSLKEHIEAKIVDLCRRLNIPVHKVTAGVIIQKDDKFLLVQEKMPIPEIFGKWNLPMGRSERKERKTLSHCAKREGEEETGFLLQIIGDTAWKYDVKLGILTMSVSIYEAKIVGGELRVPPDILDVKWFSFEDIERLKKEGSLIDPYVMRAIADFGELLYKRDLTKKAKEKFGERFK